MGKKKRQASLTKVVPTRPPSGGALRVGRERRREILKRRTKAVNGRIMSAICLNLAGLFSTLFGLWATNLVQYPLWLPPCLGLPALITIFFGMIRRSRRFLILSMILASIGTVASVYFAALWVGTNLAVTLAEYLPEDVVAFQASLYENRPWEWPGMAIPLGMAANVCASLLYIVTASLTLKNHAIEVERDRVVDLALVRSLAKSMTARPAPNSSTSERRKDRSTVTISKTSLHSDVEAALPGAIDMAPAIESVRRRSSQLLPSGDLSGSASYRSLGSLSISGKLQGERLVTKGRSGRPSSQFPAVSSTTSLTTLGGRRPRRSLLGTRSSASLASSKSLSQAPARGKSSWMKEQPKGTLPDAEESLRDLDLSNTGNGQVSGLADLIKARSAPLVESLNLARNSLGTWPIALTGSTFSSLKVLRLSRNALAGTPAEKLISFAPTLEELYIDHNFIPNLPPELGKFDKLKVLHAQNNRVIAVPFQLGKLNALETLNLDNNLLTHIPPSAVKLNALCNLSLANNSIGSLTSEITNVESLVRLSLDSNSLTELPVGLSKLPALESLSVDANSLDSLPIDLVDCQSLISLSLSSNSLEFLPSDVYRLNNLTSLAVGANIGIHAMPETLPEALVQISAPSCSVAMFVLSSKAPEYLRVAAYAGNPMVHKPRDSSADSSIPHTRKKRLGSRLGDSPGTTSRAGSVVDLRSATLSQGAGFNPLRVGRSESIASSRSSSLLAPGTKPLRGTFPCGQSVYTVQDDGKWVARQVPRLESLCASIVYSRAITKGKSIQAALRQVRNEAGMFSSPAGPQGISRIVTLIQRGPDAHCVSCKKPMYGSYISEVAWVEMECYVDGSGSTLVPVSFHTCSSKCWKRAAKTNSVQRLHRSAQLASK